MEPGRRRAGARPAKGEGAITLFDAYRLWRERGECPQEPPVVRVRRLAREEED